MNNLCFILMPYGKKQDANGRLIDFETIYQQIIFPAITGAGLEPVRGDREFAGGIIHKPMFERLILCEYAVADLTAWNANVMYELGIRHATRPWRTVALYGRPGKLPFDLNLLRAVHYDITDTGLPAFPAQTCSVLQQQLETARQGSLNPMTDSPVYQLVDYLHGPIIDHTKTDVFREQVRYAADIQKRLTDARNAPNPADAIAAVAATLPPLAELETGVAIDLMLSYRDAKAWERMIELVKAMPSVVAQTAMVQEQLGLALNRAGHHHDAIAVLEKVIAQNGPRSETCAILGRVYKDLWEAAALAGDRYKARGLLRRSIDTYLQGFEADWRDAYPGINAVTLMEQTDPRDPRQAELLPLVRYAVKRKIQSSKSDYWDHATLLELAILQGDQPAAESAMDAAIACPVFPWMTETTARNLRLIREARVRRNEASPAWARVLESELQNRSA